CARGSLMHCLPLYMVVVAIHQWGGVHKLKLGTGLWLLLTRLKESGLTLVASALHLRVSNVGAPRDCPGTVRQMDSRQGHCDYECRQAAKSPKHAPTTSSSHRFHRPVWGGRRGAPQSPSTNKY